MKSHLVDVLVLGTGPASLAAAYRLTQGGFVTVLLEKGKAVGGSMRGVRYGEFDVDLGRKELYIRIPEVDRLFSEVLGQDYRPYVDRVGSLYKGHIIELSPSFRGLRRGMPWKILVTAGPDLLWSWTNPAKSRPRNYAEYWHRVAGQRFSRILVQGYSEKFRGVNWENIPLPEGVVEGQRINAIQAIRRGLAAASGEGPEGRPVLDQLWRHPSKGTGQICELMEHAIREAGGRCELEVKLISIRSSAGMVAEVEAEIASEKVTYRPSYVVSSLQPEALAPFLLPQYIGVKTETPKRGVVLVYLFLGEEPRFPHTWLRVTDTGMRMGRITNYAAFNVGMVPEGKTCLCVEFFCLGADPLYEFDREQLRDLAIRECFANELLDPSRVCGDIVMKLPGVDTTVSYREWRNETKIRLLEELRQFENLYVVTQPGIERSVSAGLEAASDILSRSSAVRIGMN